MFHEDLAFGKRYEKKTLLLFDYDRYEQSVGCESGYDLVFYMKNYEKIKVEVKADRLAVKTGNLAIEYECNNKPSGINITTAHQYVYYIIGTKIIYQIEVETLKWLCKGCKTVCGGDGYRSKMYLLPMDRMTNYIVTPKKVDKDDD